MIAIKYKTTFDTENLTISKKHFIVPALIVFVLEFIYLSVTSYIPSPTGNGFSIPLEVLLDAAILGLVFGALWHASVLVTTLRKYIKKSRI